MAALCRRTARRSRCAVRAVCSIFAVCVIVCESTYALLYCFSVLSSRRKQTRTHDRTNHHFFARLFYRKVNVVVDESSTTMAHWQRAVPIALRILQWCGTAACFASYLLRVQAFINRLLRLLLSV